mmetsp:Transcript_3259/g.5075  ORF Transcript_3259/g.5075 Transcript_3259/m.5075 type:complete len:1600 (-) Transcript_3259:102-4901(-)|eukprot:CAMPEP_0185032424 /NCGR_PEP_ID=MMETSP1103-20130426/20483_1 /TAXON_ID=36769 /ORGANISM="Paraphysomonas bandaiensis, Strain Caron Lab Isolate" /LENGTH=1599 /DNA_ID=CAMNT_0027568319 /DNA_START=68 /DNA_END=4867 /DNA_ORIENTATION=-
MIRNTSKRSLPSFDAAPLPILNSPEYTSSNPQLNHLFIDNQYFSEPWHSDYFMNAPEESHFKEPWRLKEKMKTSGVALVVCLNIGVDPPDIVKPANCARRECYFDPSIAPKQKSLEIIGNSLQTQYQKWQSKAKYKQCLDPTAHELERICVNLRRQVKNDRLLLHYNGHGVPRPTKNGEMWVFGKHYTHYMPVSVDELRGWLGEPSIFVLDCSGAGALLPHFRDPLHHSSDNKSSQDIYAGNREGTDRQSSLSNVDSDRTNGGAGKPNASAPDSSCIVLAACQADEILPVDPQYPADIFTACLTTPIPIALRWFIVQNPHLSSEMSLDIAESIPGKDTDRKSPKGLLNWIFTAVADTIAWSVLPSSMFQKMFRQDLLVASLFRNFLLAKRIMRSFNCTPQSQPSLPDCSTHPLWQAWDSAVEHCLLYVRSLQKAGPGGLGDGQTGAAVSAQRAVGQGNGNSSPVIQSSFFNDQLMAFEVWLDFGGPGGCYKDNKEPPVCLPILLQALLSHAHRLKALHLLRRYVTLGPEAVHSILAVGVFPYILRLLHNPVAEIPYVLMSIWTYVIGFDNSCREELVKDIRDKAESKFLQCLKSTDAPYPERTMAAFVQAEICNGYRAGQQVFLNLSVHRVLSSLLAEPDVMCHSHLKKWIALCLCKICEDFPQAKRQCIVDETHFYLYPLLQDSHPAVRTAAVLALGELFGASTLVYPAVAPPDTKLTQEQSDIRSKELEISMQILESCADGCAAVRREAIIALSKMVLLPIHYEYIKLIAVSISSITGDTESLVPDEEPPQPTAYGTPKTSPNRPSSSKHFSPTKPSKQTPRQTPSKSTREKRDNTSSSPRATRPNWSISPKQSAELIDSITMYVERRELCGDAMSQSQSVLWNCAPDVAHSVPPSHAPPPLEIDEDNMISLEDVPESIEFSFPRHIASSYVQLWLCLLEVQKSDPHPPVARAAKAIFFHIKVQMTREMLTEPTEKGDLAGSARRSEGGWGGAPMNLRDLRDPTRPISQDIYRSSPRAQERPPLHGLSSASPLFLAIPEGSPRNGDGDRRPATAFALEGVDSVTSDHGQQKMASDLALMSNAYDWNRKFFLRPDMGYDPVCDLLSPEGRERSNRLLMRAEVTDLSNRIAESFRPIHDSGLATLLMEKDLSPDSNESYMQSVVHTNNSGNVVDQPQRQGMHAALLPSSLTKFESKGILRVENASLTSNAMFHAFHDILAVSDDKGVGIWSLDSGTQIMHIKSASASNSSTLLNSTVEPSLPLGSTGKRGNSVPAFTGQDSALITSMSWVNESLDSLLMVGSEDGAVKIWRDVGDSIDDTLRASLEGSASSSEHNAASGVVLASAFKALPDIAGSSVGSGMVMSWQQSAGLLSVAGNSPVIRLWDVSQEKCVTTFQTGMETCTTTLVSQTSAVRGGLDATSSWGCSIAGRNADEYLQPGSGSIFAWSFAGFADGSIGIYDQRVDSRGGRVHAAKEHDSWIVGAYLRADIPEVITGAVSGGVKFWDIRSMRSYKTIEVHKSPLTALSVHNCAPIMATGSQAQFIKILTLAGDQLGMIRYHDGFMGNRIGPVSCLAFHPVRMLMAAGSTDNLLSIYSIPDG